MELALVLFIFTILISDCLSLAHTVEIRMNWLSVLFQVEVHLPIFRGSCSIFDLMRILLIIWSAVLVHSQYFVIFFLFQEANFSHHHWTCACAISLPFKFQIVYINQNEFTVRLFQAWSSSFIFRGSFTNFELMRILLIIWISVMVHWQCFIKYIFILGSKFLSHQWSQLLELVLVLILLTIWISGCLSLAHIV